MREISKTEFHSEIDSKGWVTFHDVLAPELVQRMANDCLEWVKICAQYQIRAGINQHGDGTAHHALGRRDSLDEFVRAHFCHDYISSFFAEKPYILHAFNPVSGAPRANTYVHRIHRDTATFIPDFHFRLNMLVMLHDFTLENGATKVLPGSHRAENAPDEKEFEANCVSLTARAGSIVLFDSYLWHRGGINQTDENRVALTLSFGPAFIKPQLDYARLLGEEYGAELDPLTRQILGYNSRVPTSLDEWYRPREQRLYHADQG